MKGTIKSFRHDKGYGFVRAECGEEYFFHISGYSGDHAFLNSGEAVTFSLDKDNEGRFRAVQMMTERADVPKVAKADSATGTSNGLPYCKSCKKSVMPRMGFYKGKPYKGYCPYCASTVKHYFMAKLGYWVWGVVLLLGVTMLIATS
ncbi:cold-shock protein [Alteromonas halophila]|uniref:CSD domain-containing protein n=1 Tax=Alteromonas halophila TaxID=516698 RepID=A0A918JRR4_9ALTE|nr:cold shock domain-containing protein [Alteromonas halophila]GGW96779.1 hypothetical protein GCM10007391_33560 [Alteromonas halophila]